MTILRIALLIGAGLCALQPIAAPSSDDDTCGMTCGGVSCVVEYVSVEQVYPCILAPSPIIMRHRACQFGYQAWPELWVADELALRGYECPDCAVPGACYMWPVVTGMAYEGETNYIDGVTGARMHRRAAWGWVAAACTTCDAAGAVEQQYGSGWQ